MEVVVNYYFKANVILIFLAVFLKVDVSLAQDLELNNWFFSPYLLEGEEEQCEDILEFVKKDYKTSNNIDYKVIDRVIHNLKGENYELLNYSTLNNEKFGVNERWEVNNRSLNIDGEKIYIRVDENYAQDILLGPVKTYQVYLHEAPFKRFPVQLRSLKSFLNASPKTNHYQLMQGSKSLVLLTYQHGLINIYLSNQSLEWNKKCKIAVKPMDRNQLNIPKDLESRIKKLSELGKGIIKIPGECNNPQTYDFNFKAREELLFKLVYAPWEITPPKYVRAGFVNKHYEQLEGWAIYNLDDYAFYKEYLKQIDATKLMLSKFYTSTLGLPEKKSENFSANAVDIATSSYLQAFLGGNNIVKTENYLLRKLILERADIDSFSKFTKPDPAIPQVHRWSSPNEMESILSIAVDYPKALEYLLKIGNNPNHENGFGKTPLMYAVQRNNIESVQLLLKYGANVHTATYPTKNFQCHRYRLGHYNVSALHYAVRYSSIDIINRLLESGANPYSQAYRNHNVDTPLIDQNYSPLDWLKLLTKGKNNLNLGKDEIDALLSKLEPSKT